MSYIPDIEIDRIRDDFECIFDANSLSGVRTRESNDSAGDFFNEDSDSTRSSADIEINIQGFSTLIQRLEQGVTEKVGKLHAYVKYNVDIQENDDIIVTTNGFELKFRVTGYVPNMKGDGQYAFQDFDLEMIDFTYPDAED